MNEKEIRARWKAHMNCETQREYEGVITAMNHELDEIVAPLEQAAAELIREQQRIKVEIARLQCRVTELGSQRIPIEQEAKAAKRLFYRLKGELTYNNPPEKFGNGDLSATQAQTDAGTANFADKEGYSAF